MLDLIINSEDKEMDSMNHEDTCMNCIENGCHLESGGLSVTGMVIFYSDRELSDRSVTGWGFYM